MSEPDVFPRLEALAAIGDGRSLALLGPDCRVEWFCPERLDAAPAVWPLLDRGRGGHLHIAPVSCVCTAVTYLPSTAVLRYEWQGRLGRGRTSVAMLWPPREGVQELLWLIEGLEGQIDVEIRADLQPGWGDQDCHLALDREMATWTSQGLALQLVGPVTLQESDGAAVGGGTLSAGEQWGFRLRIGSAAQSPSYATSAGEVAEDLQATVQAWQDWAAGLRYDGPWREAVIRSAITLKMLIFEPTGAVVAAGTTSLPEEIGGIRNWDYRYTWLRDAGFALNALYSLGCTQEARAYARWLCRTTGVYGLPLRVLYGIDGGTDFPEQELWDLTGYRGSRPVRAGNDAENQLQLDSYGELLDCLLICEILGEDVMRQEWAHFRRLVDFVADHWREPDSGIWEVRDDPRHFVHSKAMAWIALDRGCCLVETYGLDGDLGRWRSEADALREEILDRGVVDGRFRRAYDDDALDASLLMLSITGFVDGTDPLAVATLDAIRRDLSVNHAANEALLLRYPPASGDGLPGREGAFGITSFWLVEALALAGRRSDALAAGDALIALQGKVGLYAEEFDPTTGAHLGNTPQAFTHIGLINAALRLANQSLRGTPTAGSSGTDRGQEQEPR
ncbi:glycoside hydrolase family 15 protein [Geodermatophilus chilensis]|uniref:glycoside hydrolase family 15 protein n=1 Tax=Geodermatophilus chilensis TaxID=2035835 RepID=UPI0012FFE5B7|nr:glycoside hydrolase family 15 protein [Geodermatophilus chilensis]